MRGARCGDRVIGRGDVCVEDGRSTNRKMPVPIQNGDGCEGLASGGFLDKFPRNVGLDQEWLVMDKLELAVD